VSDAAEIRITKGDREIFQDIFLSLESHRPAKSEKDILDEVARHFGLPTERKVSPDQVADGLPEGGHHSCLNALSDKLKNSYSSRKTESVSETYQRDLALLPARKAFAAVASSDSNCARRLARIPVWKDQRLLCLMRGLSFPLFQKKDTSIAFCAARQNKQTCVEGIHPPIPTKATSKNLVPPLCFAHCSDRWYKPAL
jgi:hypothetical protein